MTEKRVRLVTGYIPIPNHPRTAAEYGDLGERLGGVPCRKKAFYQLVEHTWLRKYADGFPPGYFKVSKHDNPLKNTLDYHAVNHQKVTWMKQAAEEYDDDVFVWVDYGIFRLPGVSNQKICEFMAKIDGKHIDIPGCWGMQPIESVAPCWRFCGSVLVCPREHLNALDTAIKVTAMEHISRTKNVEWEVNTWARVEYKNRGKLPIRWYQADHDHSLFSNYEASK